jgi:hypothetical protein
MEGRAENRRAARDMARDGELHNFKWPGQSAGA